MFFSDILEKAYVSIGAFEADFVYVSESNLCHKLLLDEAMAKAMWSCAQRQHPWLKVDFVFVSESNLCH